MLLVTAVDQDTSCGIGSLGLGLHTIQDMKIDLFKYFIKTNIDLHDLSVFNANHKQINI